MAVALKKNIRIEMSAETITRLLAQGQVCAAEIRCLDCRSKECLWRLCLETCARKMGNSQRGYPVDRSFCRVCGQCMTYECSIEANQKNP